MYFSQTDIDRRAEKYSTGAVDSARTSSWLNASHSICDHFYLVGDIPEKSSVRRLAKIGEFKPDTLPADIPDENAFLMNGREVSMRELREFVAGEYADILEVGEEQTDIDYLYIKGRKSE